MVFKTPLKNMISSKIINRDIKVMGVKFSGRLGLAAGFDKNGDYYYPTGVDRKSVV